MGFETKPNLTSLKYEQFSGETLNLSGVTVVYGEIRYGGSAPLNPTSESLASIGYVTGYSPTITVSNGLTNNNGNISWGGVLTGNTTISGNYNKYFTGTGSVAIGHNSSSGRLHVRGLGNGSGNAFYVETSGGTFRHRITDYGAFFYDINTTAELSTITSADAINPGGVLSLVATGYQTITLGNPTDGGINVTTTAGANYPARVVLNSSGNNYFRGIVSQVTGVANTPSTPAYYWGGHPNYGFGGSYDYGLYEHDGIDYRVVFLTEPNTRKVSIGQRLGSAKLTIKSNGTTTGEALKIVNSGSTELVKVLDDGLTTIGTLSGKTFTQKNSNEIAVATQLFYMPAFFDTGSIPNYNVFDIVAWYNENDFSTNYVVTTYGGGLYYFTDLTYTPKIYSGTSGNYTGDLYYDDPLQADVDKSTNILFSVFYGEPGFSVFDLVNEVNTIFTPTSGNYSGDILPTGSTDPVYRNIYFDSTTNCVWINYVNTGGGGIIKFDLTTTASTIYNISTYNVNYSGDTITASSGFVVKPIKANGYMWFGTSLGLYRFDETTSIMTKFNTTSGNYSGTVFTSNAFTNTREPALDSDGNLWFFIGSSSTVGLLKWNPVTLTSTIYNQTSGNYTGDLIPSYAGSSTYDSINNRIVYSVTSGGVFKISYFDIDTTVNKVFDFVINYIGTNGTVVLYDDVYGSGIYVSKGTIANDGFWNISIQSSPFELQFDGNGLRYKNSLDSNHHLIDKTTLVNKEYVYDHFTGGTSSFTNVIKSISTSNTNYQLAVWDGIINNNIGGVSGVTYSGNTLRYTTDFSSNYTSRSLVDKGYVTGLTGGLGNVTKVGTPVDNQVGVWTGNGTIEGTTGLTFTTNKLGLGVGTATARLHISGGTTTLAPLKLTSGTALATPENGAIEYHGSHLYFTIGSTRYQLDQQGSLTANNGLNIVGTNVRLGGNLTGSTTIGLGSNILTFTGTTGSIKYGSDLSANFTPRSLVDKGYVTGLTSNLSGVPSGVFSAYTSTNLTLNPTKPINNNYTWTIPAANPTLTWDFTGVTDGASGILEIIKDNSATERKIAIPNNTLMTSNEVYLATKVGATGKTVTGAVANLGLIRLTVSGHSLSTNDWVYVASVGGVSVATGFWQVTVISVNIIDLQGSVFAGTYTSGGSVTLSDYYLDIYQSANSVNIYSFYNRNGTMRMVGRRALFQF